MDALGIGTFAVMCWSGGGPSSYRLAAKHPDRVSALVTLAAVSMQYEFANGINSIEYSLLTGALGNWVLKEMVKHAPKSLVHGGLRGRRPDQGTSAHAHRAHLERRNKATLRHEGVGDHLGPPRRLETTSSTSPRSATSACRASRRRRCSSMAPPTPTCTPSRARTLSSTCPTPRSFGCRTGPTCACGPTRPATRSKPRIIAHLKS